MSHVARLAVSFATGIAAVQAAAVAAPQYTVTKLVEAGPGRPYADIGYFNHGFALNDDGEYVFRAMRADGTRGLFTGPDPATDAFLLHPAGMGYGEVDLAEDGWVVARDGSGRILAGNIRQGASSVRTVATFGSAASGADYADFWFPAINTSGNVIVHATRHDGSRAMVTGPTPADVVADTNGPFSNFGVFAATNNAGTIAFQATLDDGTVGVFTGGNPATDTYVDTSQPPTPAHIRPDIDINENGQILYEYRFTPPSGAGETILLSGPNLQTDEVAHGYQFPQSNQFGDFGTRAINDDGSVVFAAEAFINGQKRIGMFLGPDIANDRLLAEGDMLFGAPISGFDIHETSLNNQNQILFSYVHPGGVHGLAMMQLVPEPAVAGALVFAALLAGRRRRRD